MLTLAYYVGIPDQGINIQLAKVGFDLEGVGHE